MSEVKHLIVRNLIGREPRRLITWCDMNEYEKEELSMSRDGIVTCLECLWYMDDDKLGLLSYNIVGSGRVRK